LNGNRCVKCFHNNSGCDKFSDLFMKKESIKCDLYNRRRKTETRPDPKTTKEKPRLQFCNQDDIAFQFWGD